MDLKNNDVDFNNNSKGNKIIPNNNINLNENEENNPDKEVYFYVMTLQLEGEMHQIKIFENSDASELAFNFCKTYNLDYPTMKYLKKCIKQIISNFYDSKKNQKIYLLKDNSSIQEVAEEEIITDNSLKKSGTHKKNNSNNLNTNSEENQKSKNANLENKLNNSDIITNSNKKDNISKKLEDIENNEIEFIKSKNNKEEDGQIELKDYSIDYCLENDSIEVFSPTEHTTKIEQRSSIKNITSLNQEKNIDIHGRKKNSKNNKLQINSYISYNKINKEQKCLLNLNQKKKEKIKSNEFNTNELKNILILCKENNPKDKKKKSKSKSKSKSKGKRFELEKDKNLIKRNNYMQFNRKLKNLEKINRKENNKTVDNKIKDLSKYYRNNHKVNNKFEKFLINTNEVKSKHHSNFFDYYVKSKNFNGTIKKNNSSYKFQTNSSIIQDSNRSRSLSYYINNNKTQKVYNLNWEKKEKSMIDLNTLKSLNHQKMNTAIKFDLNSILRKDNYSKEKQKTVFKKNIKSKFNIACNNNNYFDKIINGGYHTSRNKIKNINGKELFIESKKTNSKDIKKMITESLLNIHKFKEPSKDKKKNINNNGNILKAFNKKK